LIDGSDLDGLKKTLLVGALDQAKNNPDLLKTALDQVKSALFYNSVLSRFFSGPAEYCGAFLSGVFLCLNIVDCGQGRIQSQQN